MADPSKYPTRIPPYGLRMPPKLHARVKAAALVSGRSLNAEIVKTLEEAYPDLPPVDPESLTALFDGLLLSYRKGDNQALEDTNTVLAKTSRPYKVEIADDGSLTFRRRLPLISDDD